MAIWIVVLLVVWIALVYRIAVGPRDDSAHYVNRKRFF